MTTEGHTELEEELLQKLERSGVDVERVDFNPEIFSIVAHPLFELYAPDERHERNIVGSIAGVEVYHNPNVDGKGYKIVYDVPDRACDECTALRLFDEVNSAYYCPFCDTPGKRIKDKVFKYVG